VKAQDIFMLWASLFAFLAAIGSMATASWLNDIYHHTLSHVASVAWLILSMGLIAWMKVKVSHPQFGSVSVCTGQPR
jgi:multisubunit Na+/H+ antiporter MnhG subunit